MRVSAALGQLIDESLHHMEYISKRHSGIFAASAVPILWFGDYRRYRSSEIKILTLAINPSNAEFEEENADGVRAPSVFRFPLAAKCVGKTTLSAKRKISLVDAWNRYFETAPYPWFKQFLPVLAELASSYYAKDGATNRALHIDLVTPIATSEPWSKVKVGKKDIVQDSLNRNLLTKTLLFLKPDFVFASCGLSLFTKFIPQSRWLKACNLKRFSYGMSGRQSRLHSFSIALNSSQTVQMALFEPSYHGVLGGITNKQKKQIGRILRKLV